jgi:exosortase
MSPIDNQTTLRTELPKEPVQYPGAPILRAPRPGLRWLWLAVPFGFLWFRLIDNLHVEWNTNPQYSYGWLVPLLCLGLIVRRFPFPAFRFPLSDNRDKFLLLLCALLAFLYLPTRLVEAATPEWRPIQWLLGIEAIGLTLCAIGIGKGRGWLRQLAFPIAFFFVAIPWPSVIEIPIIQALTRVSAVIVIELLGWIGVPAVAHGNIIEISTGIVGINEACSGIRSFQSSLMISLFLGEFYRFNLARRLLLIPLGFILSMAFNVCRMGILTMIAAKKGVGAISQYHDPAGVTITILCTLGLWAVAALIAKRQTKLHTPNSKPQTPDIATSSPALRIPRLNKLAAGLILWLVIVELGVHFWYASANPDWLPARRGP